MVMLVSYPKFEGAADRKSEYKSCAQSAVHSFYGLLAQLAQFAASSEVRFQALTAIKQVLHYK
jgi:hypothetical protein